ncbi:hypothetical protein SBRY_20314 [Actinacidiphila bryophytorum]|uniref:Uncharacterized protein n=1 Tax=Actinacidiphila bryophytorum TaxID=1436133 RepID=A0A9W4E3S1_9ACTN|nr:hypothetical protein SBRY_20314 [Actinacidiphila bryophytorum]
MGGLAGRPRRDRGRRLPLDPLLRLRRLPAVGPGHPDRADGEEAAAADGDELGGARGGGLTPGGGGLVRRRPGGGTGRGGHPGGGAPREL